MSIYGAIFDNQIPTSKQLGAVFKPMYTDGILNGCNIGYSGATAYVDTGMIVACGRVFEITARESKTISGTGVARLIINLDMTKAATESSFGQVYITTEVKADASGFGQLTREDINANGNIYQVELARYTVSNGDITGIVSKLGNVGISAGLCSFLGSNYYGEALPAAGNPGRIFFKKLV